MSRFALLIALLVALLLPAGARAADATFVLDGTTTTLTPMAGGKGWTAKVGLTNLTRGAVTGTVASAAGGCALTVANGLATFTVPASQHTDLTIHVPASCTRAAGEDGLAFTVAGPDGASLGVIASLAAKATPFAWNPFIAFLVALGVALAWVSTIYEWWRRHGGKGRPNGLFAALAGLDKSWSFSDSWVSNLTAAAGLVTVGLGSSDALETLLGDAGKTTLGAATVAGAVALALTGAAGVVVLSFKRAAADGVAVGGLLGGAWLAFAAALGQIWTVSLLLSKVDLGTVGYWVVIGGAVAATLLLGWYAWASLRDFLTAGTKPPPVPGVKAPATTPSPLSTRSALP
jgi:hypothetical protein